MGEKRDVGSAGGWFQPHPKGEVVAVLGCGPAAETVQPWGKEAGFCGPAQGEGAPPRRLPVWRGQPSMEVSSCELLAGPSAGGRGAPACRDLSHTSGAGYTLLNCLHRPVITSFFLCIFVVADCLFSVPH